MLPRIPTQTPNLGVSDRVRLHVVFMRTAASAVLAVVGDGRSGDPLHERGDKRKVYDSEVAKVDPVLELTRLTRRARVSTRGLMRTRSCGFPTFPTY